MAILQNREITVGKRTYEIIHGDSMGYHVKYSMDFPCKQVLVL